MFPQPDAAAFFFQNGLEQVTGQLLGLVHQKGQHHQRGKHNREVLVSMSEVVLKMIALVLQGVEGLILHFPTRPTTAHDLKDIGGGHGKVSDPTEMLCLARFDFPVLDEIDQQVWVSFIQGRLVDETKAMHHPFAFTFEFGGLPGLVSLGNIFEQELMVTFFDPQNVVQTVLSKLGDMRRIGTETIFNDDQRQVRMILAQFLQKNAWLHCAHNHSWSFHPV